MLHPSRRSSWIRWLAGLFLALGPLSIGDTRAQTLGMASDNTTRKVVVFDADALQVIGSVAIPEIEPVCFGDCVIAGDRRLGFVSLDRERIWVIDLEARPPRLAAGVNPIPLTLRAMDMDLSENGRLLVASSDRASDRVAAVIDLASRRQVWQLNFISPFTSLDVGAEGNVLVGAPASIAIRRLRLTPRGALVQTGEAVNAGGEPNNVLCVPGGKCGVVVNRSEHLIRSFTFPPLATVDLRPISEFGLALAFTSRGDRVLVRTVHGIDVFAFDPASGALGSGPLAVLPLTTEADTCSGIDLLDVHPVKERFFASEVGQVSVFDFAGKRLGAITHPDLVTPLGVCVGESGSGAATAAQPGPRTAR